MTFITAPWVPFFTSGYLSRDIRVLRLSSENWTGQGWLRHDDAHRPHSDSKAESALALSTWLKGSMTNRGHDRTCAHPRLDLLFEKIEGATPAMNNNF